MGVTALFSLWLNRQPGETRCDAIAAPPPIFCAFDNSRPPSDGPSPTDIFQGLWRQACHLRNRHTEVRTPPGESSKLGRHGCLYS